MFSARTVRQTKSLMASSGMYDGSGRFADEVGLPAKSGVSGGVIMIAPDFAVATFSPRLDAEGNSVRGVEVCRRVAEEFRLHPHESRDAVRLALAGTARPGSAAAPVAPSTYSGRHRRAEQVIRR